jgi:hypothetical protein
MPTVTYRNADGSTGQMDVNQLQKFDPQLYSQYLQKVGQPSADINQTQTSTAATGAGIPGIQAASAQKQIQAQQTASPLNLSKDLANNMDVSTAVKKYTALGMNADDVFKQYIGEKGLPSGNPSDLQDLGVTAQAIGKIGDPGSIMDRWNMKNAVTALRGLQDTFNKTSALSKIPFLGESYHNAYDIQKQSVADHLSSLIPGASQGQASNESFLSKLPDPSNPAQVSQANDTFSTLEDSLLQSKGYTPQRLGLSPKQQTAGQKESQQAATPQAPAKGGDILQNSLNDILNIGKGAVSQSYDIARNTAFGGIADADPTGTVRGALAKAGVLPAENPTAAALNQIGGIGNEYLHSAGIIDKNGQLAKNTDDIKNNMLEHAQEHPVNTALDVLGPILGAKAGLKDELPIESAGPTDPFSSAPGKVSQMVSPNNAKTAIGAIRDNVVQAGDKSGATISGKNLAQGIRNWADQAKLSNLPDAQAIDDAATQAEQQYAGKTFKPSQLKDIYDGIEKGYTAGGQPRSATASYIDRGIKGVISDQLDQAAPGFKKTSDLFQQTYSAEKSPVRAIGKNVAKGAASYGLGLAGLDALKRILNL